MKTCSIDGCARKHYARGWCKRCYKRWWTHGDPTTVLPPTTRPLLGPENGHWKGENIGYDGAHARVRREHGPATEWLCACGCGRQAAHWAYCHDAENELTTPDGRPFSADPFDYVPLAVACHKAYDLDRPR